MKRDERWTQRAGKALVWSLGLAFTACATGDPVDLMVKRATEADLRRLLTNEDFRTSLCAGQMYRDECAQKIIATLRRVRAAIKILHERNIAAAPACIKGWHADLIDTSNNPNATLEAIADGSAVWLGAPLDCAHAVCEWRKRIYPLRYRDCPG